LFKKILNYILQLATFDLNYDVRDRARFISNILKHDTKDNSDIYRDLTENMFFIKPSSPYPSTNLRVYLPGSLSQVVLHAAPGYTPLPKPGSADIEIPNTDLNNSSGIDESEGSSPEYSTEDSRSGYDTGTDEASQNGDYEETPLVSISEAITDQGQTSQNNMSDFVSTDLSEMMSRSALESWLDEKPGSSDDSLGQSQNQSRSRSQIISTSNARVSFNDRKFKLKPRKCHVLLDPANSDGLRVSYYFSTEVSSVSPLLVCVDVLFENFANEALTNISIKFEEGSGSSTSEPIDQVLEDSTR
jgi:AP-3 complex subunit beta